MTAAQLADGKYRLQQTPPAAWRARFCPELNQPDARPVEALLDICSGVEKIAVLDRNCAAGSGGIFWQEVRAALQGQGGKMVQGYLLGVGGSDVVPELVDEVVADLSSRAAAGEPVWKGVVQ